MSYVDNALANTVIYPTQVSTGGPFDIPDASCSGTLDEFGNCSGTVTPQSVSSGIFINAPVNLIAASGADPVIVTLLGFQYVWAGDLVATLTFTPQTGSPVSVDLFNRLGVSDPSNPSDVGFGAAFGGVETNGGNYVFDPAAANDIWTVASGLGNGDGVPDNLSYFPITANDVPSSPSFNTAFTGLDITGTWTLTITNFDPAGSLLAAGQLGSPGYNNFIGWQLDLAVDSVDSPEPSYAPLLLVLCMLIYAVKRGRTLRE